MDWTNTTQLLELEQLSFNSSITYEDTEVTELPYIPLDKRPETYIIPFVFALIFIVGVIGNGTLIIVFIFHRSMRNIPNIYIFSLALADLLVIVTTVPLVSVIYVTNSWPWGVVLCKGSEFFKDVSTGVSVFTLTALSGDRFFAIVDPLRKFHAQGSSKRARRLTRAIAISIWVLAIIMGLPALHTSYIKTLVINKEHSLDFCYPFPEDWGKVYAQSMVLARFSVFYAVPLLVIAIFYTLIAKHLFVSHVPGEKQGAIRQVKARRKVAVTVLAFVVIFGVCFLPTHIFMLWFYYNPNATEDYNAFWNVFRMVGFCLSFANSCTNPIALYCVSGAFRKHFNRYLLCRKSSSQQRNFDTLGVRDTSLTSTLSRRYPSRRYYQHSIRRPQDPSVMIHQNETLNCHTDVSDDNFSRI